MSKSPVFLSKKGSLLLLQEMARSFKLGSRESDGPAYEIRLDDKGQLDEVVGHPEGVHLERMDFGHWWLGITTSGGDMIHVHLTSKKKIEARVYEEMAFPRRAQARPKGTPVKNG